MGLTVPCPFHIKVQSSPGVGIVFALLNFVPSMLMFAPPVPAQLKLVEVEVGVRQLSVVSSDLRWSTLTCSAPLFSSSATLQLSATMQMDICCLWRTTPQLLLLHARECSLVHSPCIALSIGRSPPQVSARTLSYCPTHVFAFMGSELFCLFRVMRYRWISVTDSRVRPRRRLGTCFNCMMTWPAVATRPCLVP